MTAPTTSAFLLRFPEFSEQSLSVVEGALAEAGRTAPSANWGATHTEAVSYLAAHLLATRTMQLGLQVGTMSGSPTGSLLESSLYGQEYKRLLSQLPLSGFAL
jgi:hypothetical protein